VIPVHSRRLSEYDWVTLRASILLLTATHRPPHQPIDALTMSTHLPLRIARPLHRKCTTARCSGIRPFSLSAPRQKKSKQQPGESAKDPDQKAPSTIESEAQANQNDLVEDVGLLPGTWCGLVRGECWDGQRAFGTRDDAHAECISGAYSMLIQFNRNLRPRARICTSALA
jgi:hypothetical protein